MQFNSPEFIEKCTRFEVPDFSLSLEEAVAGHPEARVIGYISVVGEQETDPLDLVPEEFWDYLAIMGKESAKALPEHLLHPKYYGSDIQIRTGQEGIGNSSHSLRTAYRDGATDSVRVRLGSTDSAAPENPWAKYWHRPGNHKCCRKGRQPWWSS